MNNARIVPKTAAEFRYAVKIERAVETYTAAANVFYEAKETWHIAMEEYVAAFTGPEETAEETKQNDLNDTGLYPEYD